MRTSTYDKFPEVAVPGGAHGACRGWAAVALRIRKRLAQSPGRAPVLAVECYPGVSAAEIRRGLQDEFASARWFDTGQALLDAADIDRLVAPYLGGDDPVFGRVAPLSLEDFFDAAKLESLRTRMRMPSEPGLAGASHPAIGRPSDPAIVIGPGALLIAPEATLVVYADLARWEAQQRQRRGEIGNLGVDNTALKASLKYKRSFFIDWRVCDRLKQHTLSRWDFFLDTCVPGDPKLVAGDAYRRALAHCVTRPFRIVPFFDPGPWGGQWMKEVCDLDRTQPNYAWCFDCVPEENSLLLNFGGIRVETPALNLVLAEPRALLGEPVFGRFGAEFPIRFDFLDTMGGGNLSLQVHPLTQYITDRFGMAYTQDESYYLLDAGPGAVVYLTRKADADVDQMMAALEEAQRGRKRFDDERFIARFPARKHDHFLIPAGTVHGSGADCMVLEISATPFIFTFKLWDWNRPGLDGKPRPINLGHGRANIVRERDENYARRRLINQVTEIDRGAGWREERTGLHEAEFIETRRHWFTGATPHDTGGERSGSVNVLNLVEGEAAIVDSPEGAFEPFTVHYAETFIVPAAVGRYRVRPADPGSSDTCATIKAFVRCHP